MSILQDTGVGATPGRQPGRGLLIAGGICAILWPLLSTAYYAAYPLAAGGAMLPQPSGQAGFAMRLAELGQRPAIVTLDWLYAALPLLLWPFFMALYRLLSRRGQRDLSLVALGLGFLAICLMALSNVFNPTLLYALAQAYAGAGSEAEGAAVLGVLQALIGWMRGLNQMSSLLYQGCVGLLGLAMILSRTWRIRGWAGLLGAFLAVPAKVPLGLAVPSNALWTAVAYLIWPLAVGFGLLRSKIDASTGPQLGPIPPEF